MKNIVKFITLGALCASLVLAQRTPPDPAAMVQRQVERLTTTLSLTSAQQAQATTLLTNAHTANQSIMSSLQQARTALNAAIKSNDTTGIATLTAQIGTLEGQSLANTAKAEAALCATLTPDQQAKYTPGGGGAAGFAGRGFGGPGGGRRGGAQQ
jgi:Spy/CpxP family protein refolding chaperone